MPLVQPDGRVIVVADAPAHVHHGVPRHRSVRELQVLRDQIGELRIVDFAPPIKSHRYAAVTNQFLAPVRLAAAATDWFVPMNRRPTNERRQLRRNEEPFPLPREQIVVTTVAMPLARHRLANGGRRKRQLHLQAIVPIQYARCSDAAARTHVCCSC